MTADTDPYTSEDYQRFIDSMVPHCHCYQACCPCDGVLGGGICDDIQLVDRDEEEDV